MPILKTFCSICNPHTHCGINAQVEKGELVAVEGMPEHPANQGTLCSKGAASVQFVYAKNRLKYPMVQRGKRGSKNWERISWEEALSIVGTRLKEIRNQHGAESVVFFAGYPKWYRPFLQRLAIAFGSPNFCTESSTCNSSPTVAGNITYGHFGRPDLPRTRCLLVWSANPYHTNTTMARHLLDLKEKGVKFISVDPRVSAFAEKADLHLQLRPGTDGALAMGMIKVLIDEDLFDRSFVEQWTVGFEELWEYVNQLSLDWAEGMTGVPKGKIIEAARLYGTTKPAVLNDQRLFDHPPHQWVSESPSHFIVARADGQFRYPGRQLGRALNLYPRLQRCAHQRKGDSNGGSIERPSSPDWRGPFSGLGPSL